jgi:lipopolysaccharide/colanic/teichoic acid biosynthesis glycosyltransferase
MIEPVVAFVRARANADRMRRVADVLLVLAVSPLAVPLMLLISLLVLLALGRPILFRQRRAGLFAQPFTLWKFRSMTDDRNAEGILLPDRQRTGLFGSLLRRSRLDELPELFNILLGHMSIIGPRPLLPHTIDSMGELGRRRSSVRPGLTGWAQISGNSSLSNEEKLKLDLWYIQNQTIMRDLMIVFGTLKLMIFGEVRSLSRMADAERTLGNNDY